VLPLFHMAFCCYETWIRTWQNWNMHSNWRITMRTFLCLVGVICWTYSFVMYHYILFCNVPLCKFVWGWSFVIIVCSYFEIHTRTKKIPKNDNAAIYLCSRKSAFLYIFKVATWMIYHPLKFLTIVLCYFWVMDHLCSP
jgi:hypothetical protein